MSFRLAVDDNDFIETYNDLEKYPFIVDVALELGISRKRVVNRAAELRAEFAPIIVRKREMFQAPVEPAEKVKPTPVEHATARAAHLNVAIVELLQRSKYPVINPDAIRIDQTVSERYDRDSGRYVNVEGTPRTWISDTLRVAPITNCRNRKFLFTGAQNDAPLHEEFWANLKRYAEFIGAEIVVGPWTYETQWWSENNPISRSYDAALNDHLCFGQLAIGDNFVFCGEMNTMPTASRPISDLTTYSRDRWAVFPHAKLQLESVPSTDPRRQAHQVMTSGAVTRPKVIARKAGVKSIFHHVIGATLVEFDDDGDIFCRQINASDDGSFYDLDVFVHRSEVTTDHAVKSIVFGDLHHAKGDPRSTMACFGIDIRNNTYVAGSMLEALNPEWTILHDAHDQEIGNHHRAGDGHAGYELAARKRTSIKREIEALGHFLKMLPRKTVVVESNHDLALDRYIREGRYRNDGINLSFGLWLEKAMVDYREEVAACLNIYEEPGNFSLLEAALRALFDTDLDHVQWAYDGSSFLVDGIECGHHGFRGANGSKATINGYAKMGRKMSIGDKHSPAICEGVYGAGVMNLHHGYNKGPSGWAVTNIVQYPNGKRTLITLQAGKWRA